jgi:hypothetical protein
MSLNEDLSIGSFKLIHRKKEFVCRQHRGVGVRALIKDFIILAVNIKPPFCCGDL